MKKVWYVLLLLFILAAANCTLHIPAYDPDFYDYRVILKVSPDDADVILDGKFIGAAYEFAKSDSAMQLATKSHELVLRKEGFREEIIDLRAYSSYNITIRVNLLREEGDDRPVRKTKPESREKLPAKPEYAPKTEPEREPPKEPKIEDEEKMVKPVNVTLEVTPQECSIYLNGKFWGISPESGIIENIRLKPGKYTLEIVKPGFQPAKRTLYLKEEDVTLTIKLQK